jgi:hypothetical protein
VTSAKRIPSFPDVPTLDEIAPGVQAVSWLGISAPAQTPRAITSRIEKELLAILNTPEMQARLSDPVVGMSPMALVASSVAVLATLTANPALLTPVPGTVLITANGGQVVLPTDPPTTVTVGGLIELDANTGSGGVYTATSAIKMNAAGINSYAGGIPSVASLAGYNFIYGTTGVSICAGLPASGFQLPLTTYLYGVGTPGFTGVRLQSPNGIGLLSDTYATNLYPFDAAGLTIQGRSLPTGTVNILDCAGLTMTSSGNVTTDFVNSLSGNGIFYKDNLQPLNNQICLPYFVCMVRHFLARTDGEGLERNCRFRINPDDRFCPPIN